jgi:RimJ/RimL family protein N-acetyltransferase
VPLPSPELADAVHGIRLRPWTDDAGDVAALDAAWRDPSVAHDNPVPADVSPDTARRWIVGESDRRLRGLALDLVISPIDGDPVWGEVGLRRFDMVVRRAEVGWWLAPHARRRGMAAVAVDLLTTWALGPPLGLRQVWARIDGANLASARVAEHAGFRRLGAAASITVWARTHRR